MADTNDIPASTISLACFGNKISRRLYFLSGMAINLDLNHILNRIATSITLYSSMLKHLAAMIEAENSLLTWEGREVVRQICSEAREVLAEIAQLDKRAREVGEEDLGWVKDSRKNAGLTTNIIKVFGRPEVDLLLAQLDYLKATVSMVIQTFHTALVTVHTRNSTMPVHQQHDLIREERSHMETCIVARQLAITILNQQGKLVVPREQDNGQNLIPANSATTIGTLSAKPTTEDIKRSPILTESAGPRFEFLDIFVRRHGMHFDHLDGRMSKDKDNFMSLRSSINYDLVIDSLLQRWIKMPEQMWKPVAKQPTSLQDAPRPSLKPIQSMEGSYSSGRRSSFLQDEPPSPHFTWRGSAGRVPVDDRRPSSDDSQRGGNTSRSQDSSEKPLSTLTEQGRVYASPRSLDPSATDPLGSPTLRILPSPLLSPGITKHCLSSSQEYAAHGGAVRSAVASQASLNLLHQTHPRPDLSSDGGDSSDSDIEIPWRIRIGRNHWEFLDNKLVGPRTPNLPVEPLHFVYQHDSATTDIADHWVCEEAIIEKTYPHRCIMPMDEGWNKDEKRWRIFNALKFEEVRELVRRTNQLERIRTKSARNSFSSPFRPAPPPPEIQAHKPMRSESTPAARPSSQTNPYFPTDLPPPPPGGPVHLSTYTHSPSQTRPRSLNGPRQSLADTKGPTAHAPQHLHPPQPPQQLQQQPQQQRTVSFGGLSQPAPIRPILKHGSADRSSRTSGDFPTYQQQQQQQQGLPYWNAGPAAVASPGQYEAPPPVGPYNSYPGQNYVPPSGQSYTPSQWTYPPLTQPQHYNSGSGPSQRSASYQEPRDRSRSSSSESPRGRDGSHSKHKGRHRKKDKGEALRRKGKAAAIGAGTLGVTGGIAAFLEGLDAL